MLPLRKGGDHDYRHITAGRGCQRSAAGNRRLPAGDGRFARVRPAGGQQGSEFLQCLAVNPALEENDFIRGPPVIDPAPVVEFRRLTPGQIDTGLVADQAQHEPALFLSDTDRTGPPPDVPRRQVIAKPAAGFAQQFDVFGAKPGFFAQLTVHRIHRPFAGTNSALGELPRVLAGATGPEDLAPGVAQDNADVGPVAVRINHLAFLSGVCSRVGSIVPQTPADRQMGLLCYNIAVTTSVETFVRLAIFDLDNTLLVGDSDHLWGDFLAEHGLVDGDHYRRENDRFLAEYNAGRLDVEEFLRFSLQALARHETETLLRLREEFVRERVAPIIAPGAPGLLERHRARGEHLMIITATNRFVTEPIAEMLGVETLLATDPEFRDGRYTGNVAGTPCFREGKVIRLREWLPENTGAAIAESAFYSDSHNDLPLLEQVGRPVTVDPDEELRRIAEQRGWPVITLRESTAA